jgi:hypothetical protein
MSGRRLAAALLLVVVGILAFPGAAHAWTPGTHIYLGESVLANLQLLPPSVADLLRAFPFDFLYGNIAADSSIAKKYAPVDRHLDRIISPTIFSVRTNRRLFRGMVRLTETDSWQRAAQAAREVSRWNLHDEDVERHLGLAFDYLIEVLADRQPRARHLDPSGEEPLATAKRRRREAIRDAGRRNRARLLELAQDAFGLPNPKLTYWPALEQKLPWRQPESAWPILRLRAASDG